jgi:RHS repeat-associated protein
MGSSLRSLLCRYHYDPLDRLTSHARPETPAHQRFYCKSRLATEIQGAFRYSIVQQGDLLLAEQLHHDDALDTTLLATDQQRSVLHTVQKNLPQQPIAYSPYGHRQNESGLSSLLGFNGERPDAVTGHYLLGNGYRAFNPVLMRFNSPDSWSPFGRGGLNAYAYCKGEPVNRTDQTGHAPIIPMSKMNAFNANGMPFIKLGNYVGRRETIQIIGTAQSPYVTEPLFVARKGGVSSRSNEPNKIFETFIPATFKSDIERVTGTKLAGSTKIQHNDVISRIPPKFHEHLVITESGAPQPPSPAVSAGTPPLTPQRRVAQAAVPRAQSSAAASGMHNPTRRRESFNHIGTFQVRVKNLREMTNEDLRQYDLL